MTTLAGRILLAVHGSEEAAAVAMEVAEATGFDLHVVHVKVLPLAPPYPEVLGWREDLEWAEREARGLLDKQVEEIEGAGGTVAGAHLRDERPSEELVALAEEIAAGLIVVGSRGRGGLRRALTGSVSDWVVRHAPCPVLVVRSLGEGRVGARARSLGSSPARLEIPKKAGAQRWGGREKACEASRSGKHGKETET
jgi:nucleotide-binding universal stress UspA family protein